MRSFFLTCFAILCFSLSLCTENTNAQTAYISNYGDNTVSIINVATATVTNVCTVGNEPYGVCVSPNGKKVYVSDWGGNTVSVINTATNTVSATINVGTNPSGTVVSPDGSKIYVTNYISNTVSVIDSLTNTVTNTISVGTEPYGICVSPDGSKIYVANYGSGTVSVINTATNSVSNTIPVGTWPYGMTITPDGSEVFAGNIINNNVSVINTATNTVSATINVGIKPYGLSASPDGSKVYVANWGDNTVSVINTASNTVSVTITGLSIPWGICASPDGSKVLVANYGNNTVSEINTSTNTVSSTIPVGTRPYAVGNFIYSYSSLSATETNATCYDDNNGTATANMNGGTPPYTYLWNTSPPQTTQTATGLTAGTYSVTVTDFNGNSSFTSVTITQPNEIQTNLQQSICSGDSFNFNGQNYSVTGNYFDTLSAANGCDSIVKLSLFVDPLDTTQLSNSICQGSDYNFYGNILTAEGIYYHTLVSAYGCDSVINLYLSVNPLPIVDTGNDTTIFSGTPVELYASGGVSYQWIPSDYLDNPNSSNPISTPQNDITYIVIITDINGCSKTDTVHITVEESNLWAPNVFNPNDPDPWNQKFYVRGKGIKEIKIAVYDRWGEKVFETNNINEGWDGTYRGSPLSTAVFVYYIQATYYSGEKVVKKGDVTLFR